MKTILRWWIRRRLLARLGRVRKQWYLLSAERTTTLELLNAACQDLIRYRSNLQIYSPRVVPTRNTVNSLAVQLKQIGMQMDRHREEETQLQTELDSL